MANTKNGKKGSSKGKKSSAASKASKSKNKNTNKGTTKYVGKTKDYDVPFYDRHRTAILLTYAFLSVIFFFIAIFRGYNIWEMIRGGLFAFFGIGFYALIIIFAYIAFRIVKNNLKRGMISTNIAAFLFVVSLSSIVHLCSYSIGEGGLAEWKQQFALAVSDGWAGRSDALCLDGGIIGAVYGGTFLHAFGKEGGFVVVISTLLSSLFILLNLDAESIKVAFLKFKDKYIPTDEERKAKKDERDALRAERKNEKQLAKQLAKEKKESERNQVQNKGVNSNVNPDKKPETNKASADNFDFNETEIEVDIRPTEEDYSKYIREFKPCAPDRSVFTIPEEPEQKKADKVPVVDKKSFDEVFSDNISVKKEAQPEIADSSLSGENTEIIKDAIRTTDEQLKKNIDEVSSFVEERKPKKEYVLPPVDCLNEPKFESDDDFANEMRVTSKKLVDILASFNVNTVLSGVSRGPSVTRYELVPAPGVKISKITNLSDDIALGLASSGVRIEAPIPDKAAVGIEVPNKKRSTVTFRELIVSSEYRDNKKKLLTVALGKDIAGKVSITDLSKLPHLLIAGTTGSGKSVCLNCMIASILYNAKPSEVKLIMIDPKQVEFSVYNGIPHLLVPVISDARKAAGSLAWAVSEMENRYKTFAKCGVRDIGAFNRYIEKHPEYQYMPQIVIFIDELNDLMMVSPKEVEDSICRLAQKARAAGMHLVVATQRPSVDVITGIIKANIPARLSLAVSSQVDSRTILDASGAEKLLGNGDMLFSPVGISKNVRIQGAYLSDEEIERIVDFVKSQENAEYDDDIMDEIERNALADNKKKGASGGGSDGNSYDPLMDQVLDFITETNVASTTAIQRKLSVGYARAARIMDELEQLGYVSTPLGSNKGRKVLITRSQYLESKAGGDVITAEDDYDILSD